MSDNSNENQSAFVGWHQGRGLHGLRKLIWELADPNHQSYNPWRAITLLTKSIEDKWMAEQFARMDMGLEREPYAELENIKPPPIVDDGEIDVETQLRTAVNRGISYLETPSLASDPEYPHVIARQRLGFYHPIEEDTPEQTEAFYREELRVVHETFLHEAIYNLGEARDGQHLAHLQKQVDRHQEFLDRLDRGEIRSGIDHDPGHPPIHKI